MTNQEKVKDMNKTDKAQKSDALREATIDAIEHELITIEHSPLSRYTKQQLEAELKKRRKHTLSEALHKLEE